MLVRKLCARVRSKNAGPYWITVDLFFRDPASFAAGAAAPELSRESVAALLGASEAEMKRFELPELLVLKYSYPRAEPQGGAVERDMHGGQQYVRLLELDVGAPADG
jgi:hypothetical protein